MASSFVLAVFRWVFPPFKASKQGDETTFREFGILKNGLNKGIFYGTHTAILDFTSGHSHSHWYDHAFYRSLSWTIGNVMAMVTHTGI